MNYWMDNENMVHMHKVILFGYNENEIMEFPRKSMELENILW